MTGRYIQSVAVDGAKCCGRMTCMRVCPTSAIRVRRRRARIIEERCVSCGMCIRSCPNGAIIPLTNSFTDMGRFKYTVALASPVLYGQFGRDVRPSQVLAGLRKIGFDDAFDVADVSGVMRLAVEEYVRSGNGRKPLISSLCPVVVRLVQVRFPELVEHIIPLNPPREIAARMVREQKKAELGLKDEDIGVIYLTSCPAKMVAIIQPAEEDKSPIDGAVGIADVYDPLLAAISRLDPKEYADIPEPGGHGLMWSITSGIGSSQADFVTLPVSGLNDVIKVLEDIESRGMRDVDFISAYACLGGCVGGSLVVENPYVARAKLLHLARKFGTEPKADRDEVKAQLEAGRFNLTKQLRPRPLRPLDRDLAKAIKKMKRKEAIIRILPGVDCGACGAPTCRVFADDVVREDAKLSDCIFASPERVEELSKLYGIRIDDSKEVEGPAE